MEELTVQKLDELKHGIFAKGEVKDSAEGVWVAGTGKMIKWVAVRGIIHDWTIYTDNPYMPRVDYEDVARMGDKIASKPIIRKLVPCTDEAFELYRY